MTSNYPKYLIDTDVLLDYLTNKKNTSCLIDFMKTGICFTSVFNASELMYYAHSDNEREKVKSLLFAIKVLGIPARYSLAIPDVARNFSNIKDSLFILLAKVNKLTVVTFNPSKYSITDIPIINP